MSMDKKVILTLFVILTFLTACQKSPVSNAEVGNNGTSADIGEIQTEMKSDDLDNDPETQPNVETTVTENVQTSSKPMQSVQYSDAFSSADGTVQFTMEIDDEVLDVPMPEVLVAPHFLTAEDARRIAGVLFGKPIFMRLSRDSRQFIRRRTSKKNLPDGNRMPVILPWTHTSKNIQPFKRLRRLKIPIHLASGSSRKSHFIMKLKRMC